MLTLKIGDTIKFIYTNWKGETSVRNAIVDDFMFGSNEWHKEPQFLIRCFDLDKASMRTFAMKDISNLVVNKRTLADTF